MIKKLPPETLKYLIDLYIKIWEEGIVPKGQTSATITPLLKEGKGPKDVSYQQIALTNISKLTTKLLDGFRKKEKTAEIFSDIKKAYDKMIKQK